MTSEQQAMTVVFRMFVNRYGPRKWDIPPEAASSWATDLAAEGATADEILTAAKAWMTTNEWPPCYAELRGAIPRFCRCRRCTACTTRAIERGGSPPSVSEYAALLLRSREAELRHAARLERHDREVLG